MSELKIKQLVDGEGTNILPITNANAIYIEDGRNIGDIIDDLYTKYNKLTLVRTGEVVAYNDVIKLDHFAVEYTISKTGEELGNTSNTLQLNFMKDEHLNNNTLILKNATDTQFSLLLSGKIGNYNIVTYNNLTTVPVYPQESMEIDFLFVGNECRVYYSL